MKILLGYEVGTGRPVEMPLHHVIITGMTQLSGKTTTLEALVHRSGFKAITFRTKRGEMGFDDAHRLPLFFDERGLTHWKALEGLIESTLEEKVRREPGMREQIINVCSNATDIYEIYGRVTRKAEDPKITGFTKGVFTKLKAYLDLVVPQIRTLKLVQSLELQPGPNMMDLVDLSDETQNLILHGVIERIYEKGRDTIIVLPEAWKFLPQDRGSPCKTVVEKFIREGAAIGNFLWIDSQDLRGVDKKHLRQVDNWVLGRQRDRHEVDDTLDSLPLPRAAKPKPEDIMRLEIGHFYACLHNDVLKVYVQPRWLPDEPARQIALGALSVEDAIKAMPLLEVEGLTDEEYRELDARIKALEVLG